MITNPHDNKYADQFFWKEPKPGFLGAGFVGECQKMQKERPKKLFPELNDFLNNSNKRRSKR